MDQIQQVKAQLQEDVLTILEGFGVDETMNGEDYNNLTTALCEVILSNLNNVK
jgi:hypothetical protein